MALGTPVAGAFAYSASGGTSVSPAYPAGITANYVLVLVAGQKPSAANSGTVKNDSAVDIDGGIFTLGHYAKMGQGLGEQRHLLDGEPAGLGKMCRDLVATHEALTLKPSDILEIETEQRNKLKYRKQ